MVSLRLVLHITIFVSLILVQKDLLALDRPAQNLKGVDFKIGELISDATVTNTNDKQFQLYELISNGKPTIILPVYYNCPRLCGILFDALFAEIKEVPLKLGEEYQIVALSFNPKETVKESRESLNKYASKFGLDKKGLHFLIADQANIDKVMQSIGFFYQEDGNDYAHSAVAVFVSPTKKITHYFTGISFIPEELRLALIESSEGKLGSIMDQAMLYCYRFDQYEGRYSLVASRVVRIGTVSVVLLIVLFMTWFIYKRRF